MNMAKPPPGTPTPEMVKFLLRSPMQGKPLSPQPTQRSPTNESQNRRISNPKKQYRPDPAKQSQPIYSV